MDAIMPQFLFDLVDDHNELSSTDSITDELESTEGGSWHVKSLIQNYSEQIMFGLSWLCGR